MSKFFFSFTKCTTNQGNKLIAFTIKLMQRFHSPTKKNVCEYIDNYSTMRFNMDSEERSQTCP
jgi:hypothetical protein